MAAVLCMWQLAAVAQTAEVANKIEYGPYIQNVYETEATIVWKSTCPTVGWVEIAPNDGSNFYQTERTAYYDAADGLKRVGQWHAVRVTGLQPGTSYRYRAYSKEYKSQKGGEITYGKIAATSVYNTYIPSFTTNDRRKAETSFVVLNDIHGNAGRITKLLQMAKYKEKDMVLYNGDMVSIFDNEPDVFRKFMIESMDVFAREKSWYYVRGNHETRGRVASMFHTYFNPLEPHLYFTFRQGPVFFIMLDTGEDKPDNDIEYSGITDFDNYRTQQAEWLRGVVQSDEFKNAKYRVVIAHMPPVPLEDLWHGPQDFLNKMIPILNEAGVDIMFCGHLHRYVYQEPSDRFRFPIVVNSNTSYAAFRTDGDKFHVEVVNEDGKKLLDKTYRARK